MRKQSAELRKEVTGTLDGFNLDVGISPWSPWLFHILVFRTPLYLNTEGLPFASRSLQGKIQVVCHCVVCLAIAGEILYAQAFKRNP